MKSFIDHFEYLLLNISKELILPCKYAPQISQFYNKMGIIVVEKSFKSNLIGNF